MRQRTMLWACVAVALLGATSCVGVEDFFTNEFLRNLGLGEQPAALPGAAPVLSVSIDNRTGRTIEALLSFRLSGDTVEQRIFTVAPGITSGTALVCPVDEITLGDVSDLDRVGVVVRLGNGGEADPVVEVEPFGVLLREGANYDCGDAVTFAVFPSSATRSGYQTIAEIQRAP